MLKAEVFETILSYVGVPSRENLSLVGLASHWTTVARKASARHATRHAINSYGGGGGGNNEGVESG